MNSPTGHRYLHGHHESVLRSHRQRTAQNSAAYLLPRLRPDDQVLDVGCGPGTITADLAQRVPGGRVVGVDAASSIVDEARSSSGVAETANLSFEVGDVYHLNFEDGRFDIVHAHQVLQHLTDPVTALVELRRVCRPGGLVACRDGDYGAMFWYPGSDAMSDWRTLYRPFTARWPAAPAGSPTRDATSAAGRVPRVSPAWRSPRVCGASRHPRSADGGAELWAERLTRSRFAEQATAQRLSTEAELARLADGWRAWTIEEDGCFFVPHGEVLCLP